MYEYSNLNNFALYLFIFLSLVLLEGATFFPVPKNCL